MRGITRVCTDDNVKASLDTAMWARRVSTGEIICIKKWDDDRVGNRLLNVFFKKILFFWVCVRACVRAYVCVCGLINI